MIKEDSEFLKCTQQFWSEKYGRGISMEEAKEIVHNLAGFYKILLECGSNGGNQKSIE